MAFSAQQDDYEIALPLGGGGMSLVFLVKAPDGQLVVMKRLRPELAKDSRLRAAFVREARLTAQLQQENVVRVLDTSGAESSHFILMEYVHGVDVATLLEFLYDRGATLPLPVVASIFRDLCAGLMAAHAQDIVHRDVTAGNVLVSWKGQAKLTDFGIAKATSGPDQRLTRTGTTKGTLAYMAPEQVLAMPSDLRVDVYAATVVLYEMITRFNPFLGETDFDTMSRVLEAPLPSVAELRSDAPMWLDDVVALGTFRDPERRYPSVAALRKGLDPIAGTSVEVQNFLSSIAKDLEQFAQAQRQTALEEAEPVTQPERIVEPKKAAPAVQKPLPLVDPLQQTMRSIPVPKDLLKK